MRVVLDTNVVLDVLFNRPGFAANATAIWDAGQQGRFEGYISSITPVNVFYIARKLKDATAARQAVQALLAAWQVCPTDQSVLQAALSLPLSDYEDAVQHAGAVAVSATGIVTRNIADFKGATLSIFSPEDFLASLGISI